MHLNRHRMVAIVMSALCLAVTLPLFNYIAASSAPLLQLETPDSSYRATFLAEEGNFYIILPTSEGHTLDLSTLEFRVSGSSEDFPSLFISAVPDATQVRPGTCFRLTSTGPATKLDQACTTFSL